MSSDLETGPIQNTNPPVIEETRKWDVFRDPPQKVAAPKNNFFDFLEKLAKILTYAFTFAMVLGCAALSKGTLLFMTSQIADDVTRPVCEGPDGPHDRYKVSLDPRQKIAWIWMITFVFFVPQAITFFRSLRILIFKSWKRPRALEVFSVFITESLQTIGLALLVFQILPSLDVVKGAMLTNAVCLIPGSLCLVSRYKEEDGERKLESNAFLKITLDLLAIASQTTALIIWPILYGGKVHNWSHVYLIPISMLLISFGWWENYVSDDSAFTFIRNLARPLKTFENSRYVTYLFVSIWKCALFFGLMFTSTPEGVERSAMFHDFTFADHPFNTTATDFQLDHEGQGLIPVWVFLINIGASYFCYVFAKFACKIYIHRFSYAFPTILAMPVTIMVLIVMGVVYMRNPSAYYGHIPVHLFYNVPPLELLVQDHVWIWLLWLLSQIWITVHIWTPTSEKLATTERLFVRPMYDPFLVDQDIALNRRRNDRSHDYEQINQEEATAVHDAAITRIYVCGTMWHETKDEVMDFLKSIMRLDEDQSLRRKAMEHAKSNASDYYELETHIFFDDAFVRTSQDDPDPQINSYVKDLIQAVSEATNIGFPRTEAEVSSPEKYHTPYGGRLVWTLPGKTQMIAHLKDKKRIRVKKRWSQVMYMYYLLGHRLMELDLDVYQKDIRARNTYILALDGDTDFEPKAVHLLVELMKKNENLGAACGRIHPVGFGPMVWYQMFEYSIAHWLQKATEHVLGCVLCSPGCFSLFRGKALMDDGVIGKFTSKSIKAMHCIQHNQGEDGWLCILLLKKGYRVEYSAASDSYTHCPEGFGEFYHQRRRWISATLANIFDLLSTSKQTRQVNDNISLPYVMYQWVIIIGTMLGPGMIFLMLLRASMSIFNLDPWLSLFLNLIPVFVFVMVCAFSSNDKLQILVAGTISGMYALLMTALLIGILLQIPILGPLAPSSLFILFITGQVILSGLLHPKEIDRLPCGLVYYIAIPCMFLLLIIYCAFGVNNISWGTREVTVVGKTLPAETSKSGSKARTRRVSFFGGEKGDGFGCSMKCVCCTGEDGEEETQWKQVNTRNDETSEDLSTEPKANLDLTLQTEGESGFDRTWFHDPVLDKSKKGSISVDEETFFKELIAKYLDPNDDIGDKARVQEDLKDLRDKIVLIFFMFNVAFIAVLFLLTLAADQLSVIWPWGATINFTYDDVQGVVIHKEYLHLEPVGIVFLLNFSVILVQFLAMIKHRLRTFSQVMSNTSLGVPCFNSERRNLKKRYSASGIQHLQGKGSNDEDDEVESRAKAAKGHNGSIPLSLHGAYTNLSYA